MNDEVIMCNATTKAGTPCKNRAAPGLTVCRIHGKVTEKAATAADEASEPTPEQRHQFEATIAEINRLANKLQEMVPGYIPPAFSPIKAGFAC